jgi:hypothetical protein
MIDTLAPPAEPVVVEATLRQELAHGDAMIGTIAPILRHLLTNDEHSVFGDEIIAAMRGMMSDVARQLLDACAEAGEGPFNGSQDRTAIAALVEQFALQSGFLAHVHSLAMEAQLTSRLEARLSLDPVLSPLLQALIASHEPPVAGSAMALLAAQARFIQQQRRMQLPIAELPGDLLHGALIALQALGDESGVNAEQVSIAERQIRASFDEGRSRIGLISRLITGMGGGATAALSVTHGGVAMFVSALAIASGQGRDMAILATNESQVARLALALRSAGLKADSIEEQFVSLHPEVTLPPQFETIGADHAAALLARSAAYPGG